jgi:selenium metabolism protein YedF
MEAIPFMSKSNLIDARGLACPKPVLETKRALDEDKLACFTVLVDNPAAKENVARFANSRNCSVSFTERAQGCFEIHIERQGGAAPPGASEAAVSCACGVENSAQDGDKHVVYVSGAFMGIGDDALGAKLMRGFLRTWIDAPVKPWRMVFINSGVRLTTVDDEAVEALEMLRNNGVDVLSCGTCLEHFGLQEKLRVGRVTNMYEVVDTLSQATKVVSPI